MDILPVPVKNKFPMICHKLHPVFAQIAFCKPVVLTKTVGTVQIIFFQQLFTEDDIAIFIKCKIALIEEIIMIAA